MATSAQKVRTNVYLDANMKQKAQEIFKTYGMGLSDAFNIFLSQVVIERGIPFQIKLPNDTTLQAMKDVENNKNMQEISLDDLVKEMDTARSA